LNQLDSRFSWGLEAITLDNLNREWMLRR
jgi:hypothetical protein